MGVRIAIQLYLTDYRIFYPQSISEKSILIIETEKTFYPSLFYLKFAFKLLRQTRMEFGSIIISETAGTAKTRRTLSTLIFQ
jgi:hypothetical protein